MTYPLTKVMDEFYLQDSRSYVGNDVVWWARDGNGYTTDLSKAHVFTREEAQRQHDARPTDIPWPKRYIDAKTRPAVDMQYIRREEALRGSGIVLETKQERTTVRTTFRCTACGRFMSERALWSGACPSCGTDNRP
ncbi:hypothetical protein [Thauera propionica]|uniref:hypothetical protein n=1 Tax=Thauera propionica TaxID=2019431 RepID=UPI0023F52132|nr:hypothetical protein [Thauera propionica]MDD3675820.1 hypothetical protein [Thauera propionica]